MIGQCRGTVPAADGATVMRGSSVKKAWPMLKDAEGSQRA